MNSLLVDNRTWRSTTAADFPIACRVSWVKCGQCLVCLPPTPPPHPSPPLSFYRRWDIPTGRTTLCQLLPASFTNTLTNKQNKPIGGEVNKPVVFRPCCPIQVTAWTVKTASEIRSEASCEARQWARQAGTCYQCKCRVTLISKRRLMARVRCMSQWADSFSAFLHLYPSCSCSPLR